MRRLPQHSVTLSAVLVETRENRSEITLVKDIKVFRRIDDLYRRSHEVHTVQFEVTKLCEQIALSALRLKQSVPTVRTNFRRGMRSLRSD
jgi:hypothetical protein